MKYALPFLTALKANNEREWMLANKPAYEVAKAEVLALAGQILHEFVPFERDLEGLAPSDGVFRINRDVRFSNDKRPYKENMSIYFARGGKKSPYAGYYLHIEPGNKSFLAGGSYMPEADALKRIRQEIDYKAEDFGNILSNPDFKRVYGELGGEKLKTAPKGYPKDHPNVEWLKHKAFIAMSPLTDDEVCNQHFLATIIDAFRALQPLVHFLNTAIEE